jgi:putative flippase GtrA
MVNFQGRQEILILMQRLLQKLAQLFFGVGSIGRYGLIGFTGVALDLFVFLLLTRIGVFAVTANILSTLLGITNNFIWNSLLNFREGLSPIRGAKFATVGLLGLTVSTLLLSVFLFIGLEPVAAKWLIIPLVVSAQYLANRNWTFRK